VYSASHYVIEVLIAIRSVGICGTDVHFLKEGHVASFGLPSPTVLGHEASGVVIAVGEDVTTLQLGGILVECLLLYYISCIIGR
jgi:threonine dehydrogenase-like Zn-dependent dehydrogenase